MAEQLTSAQNDGTRPTIGAPPGKGPADENFPVASRLIAARLRPHVLCFYAFARAADDIADSPTLDAAGKLRRLEALEAGLADGASGPPVAAALARSLAETGVSDGHARRLLAAFRQDAVKNRYADWDELMAYCALSARPVGRYLLELHGEGSGAAPAADALSAALQVLNHVQDLAEDRRRLDRVYLPLAWMDEAGAGVAALDAPRLSPALRRVVDRCLDGAEALLRAAAPLAARLRSRRLAAEAAMAHHLAGRLARRLRYQDPLAGRVVASRGDLAAGALAALARLLVP